MSSEKKTDILKIVIGAALAAASVLFVWLFKNSRFQNIPPVLITAAIIAFIAEVIVLVVMKSKNAIVRTIKILVLFIINISVFSSAVIYSFAPAVILQPHFDEASYVELQGEEYVEEITFNGKNSNINGWFYNKAGESAPTVLYFYGNYENAATRLLWMIRSSQESFFDGFNFAVFDYPAYGKSEGKCTDETLLSFSLDVYDELSKKTKDIIVLGYSVGTGPATYLASERDVKGLILYAPYADGTDLYNNVIDIFHGPLESLVSFNIESEKYAENINIKPLIIASPSDELIPFRSSKRLSEAFSKSEFVTVERIGHNDFWLSSKVLTETKNYLKEAVN